MDKIEISLGEADDASIEIDRLTHELNLGDGPQPEKENPTIWRYRTFEELVEFLSSRKLWFSQVSQFDDPYEGISFQHSVPTSSGDYFSTLELFSGEDETHADEEHRRDYGYALSYANCWHMNENESAALWNQYGGQQNAVAIKSTTERLQQVLGSETYRTAFGKVEYGLKSEVEAPKFQKPVFRKRDDFRYEKEYRAVLTDFPRLVSILAKWERIQEEYAKYNGSHLEPSIVELMPKGEAIEVNLDSLVESIYVDPTAKDRFVNAVRAVVSEFVDCPVKSSSIFEDPLS